MKTQAAATLDPVDSVSPDETATPSLELPTAPDHLSTPASDPTAIWVVSERLGKVALPKDQSFVHEPGFTREEAKNLLSDLARNLGLGVLENQDAQESGLQVPEPAIAQAFAALDLVWLQEGQAVAAFAFEPGDKAWVGPRRIADLIALYPKVKIPFYVVVMPNAHQALCAELHRPAYQGLKRPLHEMTRLLHWPRLATEIAQIGNRARYLKPEFLSELSESAS